MSGKKAAVVFPGQGSQRHGMGRDFYEMVPASRETFQEASDALGWDVAAMCFGEDQRLHLTEYAQPCILVTEIAMLRGLRALYGLDPRFFGGHSLGEYTALVAAGVFPLSTVIQIVHIRGKLMQEAIPIGIGGMSAIVSRELDVDTILEALRDLPIDLANINSANQVVISGETRAMPEAETRIIQSLSAERPLRFIPLNVSAPFHSRFMNTIENPFEDVLNSVRKVMDSRSASQVASNFTGGFHSNDTEDILNKLVSQLSNTVRWKDNMHILASTADVIYEVGPNRPLRDFFRTIGVSCLSLTTLASAQRAFQGN